MSTLRNRLAALLAGAAVLGATSVFAQTNEDEWYDPTDWFDGNNYEYDDTWGDETWDTETYNDFDLFGDYGVDDYDYDTWGTLGTDAGNQKYGWHYDWNPVSNTWRSDYGYYTSQYDYDASGDYGWHYDWNPQQEKWVSDYGWHSSNWDFDRSRFDYSQQNQQQRQQAETAAKGQKQQNRQRAQQKMAQTGNRHTVRGEIEALRRVSTGNQQGQQAQRTLADIRLQSGQRVVVDLGSRQRSNVQRGDEVVLRGRSIQLNGRDVLLAEQIRVGAEGGQQARGSAMGQQRGSGKQSQQSNRSGTVVISGQLQEVKQASLDGRENHTLLRVELENGRQEIVDLGPNFAQRQGGERVRQLLDRADEGDRITIRGERQQVNGRSIVRARQFRLDGEQVLQQQRSSGSGN